MNYVALLRGINVGKTKRVDMKTLKHLFENIGCVNVSTYINSGNVFFETNNNLAKVRQDIEHALMNESGEEIKVLIKTKEEIIQIANSIPADWVNDTEQRTDVAYLFSEANRKEIINELPVKLEYIELKYVDGALIWNIDRKNLNKSQINRIISHAIYQQMTVRNANTARYLASRYLMPS